MRSRRVAIVVLLLAAAACAQNDARDVSFVVLGHLRGDPGIDRYRNGILEELAADCKVLAPDLVFLTGDSIWGDYHGRPTDRATVEKEWDVLDAALATIGAPVHRVPGNHDINDLVTRDVYHGRYGKLPQAVRRGRNLFLLMSSAWTPRDGEEGKAAHVHGLPLDTAQLDFLKRELGDGSGHDNAFVFVHHLLWWSERSSWWTEVHPILQAGKVRAVFGGDYGPTKFSHVERDGIDYVHAAVETTPSLEMLRVSEKARLLSQQLDVYLWVQVRGDDVDIDVRTAAPLATGRYSPAAWRDVNDLTPKDYLYYNVLKTTSRKRKVAMLLAGGGFIAGLLAAFILGRLWRRIRRRP